MATAPFPPARAALPALLLANLALACGPWLVRLAEAQSRVGPIGSALWRLALAFPALLMAARIAGERPPARPARVAALGGVAGLLFAADLASWHLGILRTRLANATLLANNPAILFPLYGFVAAWRWPSRRQAAALALAATGIALLLGRSFRLSAAGLAGDALSLLAGLCYTAYLVVAERMRGAVGPWLTLSLAAAAGMPALLALAWAAGEPVWPHAWLPLVALATGSQLIGQGLLLYAVGRVSPLAIGLTLLVQPMVAALIGWAVYGERPAAADLLGAAAIGAAILLVRARPRLGGPAATP